MMKLEIVSALFGKPYLPTSKCSNDLFCLSILCYVGPDCTEIYLLCFGNIG
jgi:hypothetical protein